MAVDVELLRKVMEEIEKFPETHNQGSWFMPLAKPVPSKDGELCKTAFCFAGHAAVLSGVAVPDYRKSAGVGEFPGGLEWGVFPDTLMSVLVNDYEGEELPEGAVKIHLYAAELLGLDANTAGRLFAGRNSRGALRMMVEHIIENGSVTFEEYCSFNRRADEEEYRRRKEARSTALAELEVLDGQRT